MGPRRVFQPRLSIAEGGFNPPIDVAQQSNPGRLRVDLNAYLPAGQAAFYRAGLYDFSERNRLNLQRGQRLGDCNFVESASPATTARVSNT